MIPAGADVTVRYGAGFKQLILRVDPAELLRKIEQLTGVRPQGSLEFCRDSSFSQPNLDKLRNLALFFVDEIGSSASPWPELLRVEFEQTLLVAFLHGHRHSFSHLLEQPAESAAPRQVRAAEAYIEANWNQPLTIEAIAVAAGVSVRSLFKSFSASKHGSSPMAFVKTIRLRHAQDMLHRAEPTTTVSGTAFACGFQNLGHFAKQYQLLIGELPSETLAQTRIAHV
jgi:AraC-like DNA-binding protein